MGNHEITIDFNNGSYDVTMDYEKPVFDCAKDIQEKFTLEQWEINKLYDALKRFASKIEEYDMWRK